MIIIGVWCNGSTSPLGGFSLGSSPSTPTMRVWFNGKISSFQEEDGGSIPLTRSSKKARSDLAFLLEYIYNEVRTYFIENL